VLAAEQRVTIRGGGDIFPDVPILADPVGTWRARIAGSSRAPGRGDSLPEQCEVVVVTRTGARDT
jgi:hypothetical protein